MSSHRDSANSAGGQHFQTLARHLPGALLRHVLDPSGQSRIVELNAACAALLGLSRAQLINNSTHFWAMVDPQDLKPLRAALEESATTQEDWRFEWRITTAAGQRKWLLGEGRPETLPSGATGWNTRLVDVTHGRHIEASRIDSNNRFRQMLDSVPNVSVQGYGLDLKARYWNKASERLYGFTAEEAIGKTLLELIIPEPMHNAVKEATRSMFETGEAIPEGDLMLRRKDGTPIEVFSSHVYLDIPHQGPELYCIDFDLSERREAESMRTFLESQLRESQKMQALGTLAGGVAHDFNNIVAAILGNVELALSDLPQESTARTSLKEIRKASQRARSLIKQIMAFSRRQVLERRPMRLHHIVEESTHLVRSTLPPGITLRVACESPSPRVLADATQIGQVLLNLCTNAWQAMPAGHQGLINVTLHTFQGLPPNATPATLTQLGLHETPVSEWVCLTVADNGTGMSAETRSRIFEPFFTTKPSGTGTGLGLAVVHGIARDHQAILDVQSEPGEGSIFAVYFPVNQGSSGDPATSPALLPSDFCALDKLPTSPGMLATKGPTHILYLDDDDLLTFLMKRLLEKQKYRVSVFEDAKEALESFRKAPEDFDLVISDYNMPGMSGLDFARAIKACSAHTPVAITSGHLSEELRNNAPAAGVSELIYKPDSVEDLFAAVDRLAKSILSP